jgi:hypothetical protein
VSNQSEGEAEAEKESIVKNDEQAERSYPNGIVSSSLSVVSIAAVSIPEGQ